MAVQGARVAVTVVCPTGQRDKTAIEVLWKAAEGFLLGGGQRRRSGNKQSV
jgi:hypothetical protein